MTVSKIITAVTPLEEVDKINEIIDNLGGSGGNAQWGSITGTLSNQTDLNTALSGKQESLVSGTNIKTINNESLLGSGNIEIQRGITEVSWGDINGALNHQIDLTTALDAKAPLNAPAFSGIPTAPTASIGTNTTQIATTAFVEAKIQLVNELPQEPVSGVLYLIPSEE